MAILVECPQCRHRQGDDSIPCKKCNASLKKFSHKVYWIEYYSDGRRKRERIGPNKALAETTFQKRMVERAEGRLLDKKKDDRTTFSQLSKWYLQLAEVKRKKSFIRDERSIEKLSEFFGLKFVKEIKPSLVAEYQSLRLSEKSYRGHLTKPATVNRETACLKTIFNKAIRDGKIERNPVRGVKLLRENNERHRVLSSEEWEKYQANCPPWYLPVALTAYFTAMRRGEIANLTLSRLDLKEGFIRLRPEDTKTESGRSIPLHPELTEVLKKLLKVRPLNSDRVFHRNGKPITLEDIRRAHAMTCKKAAIREFVFHDFRRTRINLWRTEGHDYFKIMAASGHKTMSVFRRYNTVSEAELRTLNFRMDTYMDTKENSAKEKEVSENV